MNRTVLIDELTLPYHIYLKQGDQCYYFLKYTAGKDYTYSDSNKLIKNFKKVPSVASEAEMYYKGQATNQIAKMLRDAFSQGEKDSVTFVPVPPSKTRDNSQYDGRLYQALRRAFGDDADIRELVEQHVSTESSHNSDDRLTPTEVFENLYIIEKLKNGTRDTIVIFDDVVTNGTHFIAMRRILKSIFPNANYIGLFICRRETRQEIEEDDFDEDLW